MQMHLPRVHDLPPFWDGFAVVWDKWESEPDLFICPPLKSPAVCAGCGLVMPRATARGRVAASTLVTHDKIAANDENRQRLGWAKHNLKRNALIGLTAFRCTHCGHDSVFDHAADESWDLDPADYGDQGSHAPTGRTR